MFSFLRVNVFTSWNYTGVVSSGNAFLHKGNRTVKSILKQSEVLLPSYFSDRCFGLSPSTGSQAH